MTTYKEMCAIIAAKVVEENRETIIKQVKAHNPRMVSRIQLLDTVHIEELESTLHDTIDRLQQDWCANLAALLDDQIDHFLGEDEPETA